MKLDVLVPGCHDIRTVVWLKENISRCEDTELVC